MKLRVMSRRTVETSAPLLEPHAFISIVTPGDPNEARLPTNDRTRGVLRMRFHDLDRWPPDGEPGVLLLGSETGPTKVPIALFCEDQAEQIIAFVKGLLRDPGLAEHLVLIVHCDAGWSRSPAVAAAIEKGLLGRDDSEWFKRCTPNRLVYRTILNVSAEHDA